MKPIDMFFSDESQLHYCIKLFLIEAEADINNELLAYLFSGIKSADDPNLIRNQLLKAGIITTAQL